MSENGDLRALCALVLLLSLGLLTLSVLQKRYERQHPLPIVRSLPLPDLVSELRYAKGRCEQFGVAVRAATRNGRLSGRDSDDVKYLYRTIQTEFDRCVDDLRFGLAKPFCDGDRGRIDARMTRTNWLMMDLEQWAHNRLDRGDIYDMWGPLSGALTHLPWWLTLVREENERSIERLRKELAECHMAEWSELK